MSEKDKMTLAREEIQRLLFSIWDSKAFTSTEKQRVGEFLAQWAKEFEKV